MDSVRFYNPGFKFVEMLRFDNPTVDIVKQNPNSYHHLAVPEKDFFDVPVERVVQSDGGDVWVSTRFFADRIQKEYRSLGVVRINPNAKEIHEDDNVALNEKDAKEKGERLWLQSMKNLISEHEAVVAQTRANGQRPRAATGNTKYALKLVGMEDPADDIDTVLSRKQDNSEVDGLKKSLAALQAQMSQLLAKAAK